MVLKSSRIFRVVSIGDSLRNSKYIKWYVRFDCLDELSVVMCSNSSLEILLYSEILNILQNKREQRNSWNSLESNPKTMLCGSFHAISCNSWWLWMSNSDRQQVPPSLTFASPWAKPISTMDQELLLCFYVSKVHMCSKQEVSSRLKQTILTSNLLITFNYGAFGLHSGLK
jgi:hypothetical protein